jgi:hypothetical protein
MTRTIPQIVNSVLPPPRAGGSGRTHGQLRPVIIDRPQPLAQVSHPGVDRVLQNRGQRPFLAGLADDGDLLITAVHSLPPTQLLQWLEPAAHTGLVAGSSPAGPTNEINWLSKLEFSLRTVSRTACFGGLMCVNLSEALIILKPILPLPQRPNIGRDVIFRERPLRIGLQTEESARRRISFECEVPAILGG